MCGIARETTPPRPPNAWILYRAQKVKELRAKNLEGIETVDFPSASGLPSSTTVNRHAPQAEVSRTISLMWRSESADVKKEYCDLADVKKRSHQEMFPDYKYRPRRNTPAAQTTVKMEDGEEAASAAEDKHVFTETEDKPLRKKKLSKRAEAKLRSVQYVDTAFIPDFDDVLLDGVASASRSSPYKCEDRLSDLTSSPTQNDLAHWKSSEASVLQQIESDDWSSALRALEGSKRTLHHDEGFEEEGKEILLPEEDDRHHRSSRSAFPWPIEIQTAPLSDVSQSTLSRPYYPYLSSSEDGPASASTSINSFNYIPGDYNEELRDYRSSGVDMSPNSISSNLYHSNSDSNGGGNWSEGSNMHSPSPSFHRLIVGEPTITLSPLHLASSSDYLDLSISAPPIFSLQGNSPSSSSSSASAPCTSFMTGFSAGQAPVSIHSSSSFLPYNACTDGRGKSHDPGLGAPCTSSLQEFLHGANITEGHDTLSPLPLNHSYSDHTDDYQQHPYSLVQQQEQQEQQQQQQQEHQQRHPHRPAQQPRHQLPQHHPQFEFELYHHHHQSHLSSSSSSSNIANVPSSTLPEYASSSNLSWHGALLGFPTQHPLTSSHLMRTSPSHSTHSTHSPSKENGHSTDYFDTTITPSDPQGRHQHRHQYQQQQARNFASQGVHLHEGFYNEDDLMQKLFELSQQDV
ncbi:hypothetical protein CBS101457_003925 [Exobasidium rhododendri]|nr:hypothetical protein CBS101457_003925 [Exobasidium rhododendri]